MTLTTPLADTALVVVDLQQGTAGNPFFSPVDAVVERAGELTAAFRRHGLPVVIAMWGTRARLPTVGFVGWFGPRGLASIVFAVIIVEESALPHEALIVQAIYVTVGLSVLAHGLTAAPLADRYARWYEQHPQDEAPPMESAPAEVPRPRGSAVAGRRAAGA